MVSPGSKRGDSLGATKTDLYHPDNEEEDREYHDGEEEREEEVAAATPAAVVVVVSCLAFIYAYN